MELFFSKQFDLEYSVNFNLLHVQNKLLYLLLERVKVGLPYFLLSIHFLTANAAFSPSIAEEVIPPE